MFSNNSNDSNLHQLSNNQGIGILVNKCGLCNNLREGVEYSIQEVNDSPVSSLDDLLFQIKLDRKHNEGNLKITFNKFSMQCMTHKDMMPGSTSIDFNEADLEILNKTPISKIYLAIDQ